MIPVGFLPRPKDVADLVAFLTTPAATFLSGNPVPIDGGMRNAGIGIPGMGSEDPRRDFVSAVRDLREARRYVEQPAMAAATPVRSS